MYQVKNINTKEDFILFCSLFDGHSNLLLWPTEVLETEKKFSYTTYFRYEIVNEQHPIRIEWLKDYQEIVIHCLDERGDILTDQQLEVFDDLFYAIKETQTKYIRQLYHLTNAKRIGSQFNSLYEECQRAVENYEYVSPESLKELQDFAEDSTVLLKELLTLTSGTAKEAINELLLANSTKMISFYGELMSRNYLRQLEKAN